MPLFNLKFKPGLNRDQTNYANEGGWYECDKIRFRSGQPQKLGGWLQYGTFTLVGICRQLFNWVSGNADNILALGTNEKVYLEVGGNLADVTPIRETFSTPDTDDCFGTTDGSTVVVVSISAHGATEGDWVTFSGAVDTNGIPAAELNAEFKIYDVAADSFKITVTTAATSTGSGGGTAIDAAFQINIGPEYTIVGYGWGSGGWGRGGWGSGTLTPIYVLQRDWFFDNFDNDLVMNIRNGAIYYWAYNAAFDTRAVLLSSLSGANEVPAIAWQTMVSQNDKHLLAFGCVPYGSTNPNDFDPLLIRWSNQDDPVEWEPTPTNSAGFLRVSRGSKIVRALPSRQEILVFTDASLYSLQFLGTTDVFGLQELADNISIMGPRAVTAANNVTYWMGNDKFYMYDGRVQTLPCTLRNHVFNDFNYDQTDQVVCGTNEGFQEIWWFYCSENSNTNDRYVVYKYSENIWYYGTIGRTAWLDSPLRQYPQAVGCACHKLYDHERGVDADVDPMISYITSSDMDIGDGDKFMLINRVVPDLSFQGSTVENPQVILTMKPRRFPGSNYQNTNEPDVTMSTDIPVEQYTEQVFIRARARQMGLKIQSNELGVNWQLGVPRLDGRTDGKR